MVIPWSSLEEGEEDFLTVLKTSCLGGVHGMYFETTAYMFLSIKVNSLRKLEVEYID